MNNTNEMGYLQSLGYDSFGMITVGRNWEVGSEYRYGFNGKESDSETYGDGNVYDYGFRIYNPRLGKFLSVDPLQKKFAWYTPFQFAGNQPIWAIDLDGLEEKIVTGDNSFLIKATYAVEQKVADNIDIKALQDELNRMFNDNPTLYLEKFKSLLTDEEKELMRQISDNDQIIHDDKPREPSPLVVKFEITIVIVNEDDTNVKDPSNSRIYTKTGQSLGGLILMGKESDPKFAPEPVTDPITNQVTGTFTTQAYYDGTNITLNPKYYDKSCTTYVGDAFTIDGYRGIGHEIAHDFNLNHPVGQYPEKGVMSNHGERNPTLEEIKTIIDDKNENIIQPGQKND